MAITNSEQGTITEAEFVKIVMITSDGRAVPTRPVVDDDHRDFDIHLRRFMAVLATQLKTSLRLRKHGRQLMLQVTFYLKPPIFTSRQFWYFVAHFDVQTMTFTEPMYLIPSTFMHKHGRRGSRIGKHGIPFEVKASLGPDADDKWTPFRVRRAQLGPRIVQILKKIGAAKTSMTLAAGRIDGAVVLVERRRSRRASLKAAA